MQAPWNLANSRRRLRGVDEQRKHEAMKIAEIVIGKRHRTDMGDIEELARSIEKVGLLHPVVITPDRHLIAGVRRIEAFKSLGRDDIPARLVKDLPMAIRVLAESDENTCRKGFTPSEAVAMAAVLEPMAKKKAEDRRAQQGSINLGHSDGGQCPPTKKSKSRDEIAAAVGMSARTLEKARTVVKAAEADPTLAPVVEEMDRTGKVDPALRQVKPPKKTKTPKIPSVDSVVKKLAALGKDIEKHFAHWTPDSKVKVREAVANLAAALVETKDG